MIQKSLDDDVKTNYLHFAIRKKMNIGDALGFYAKQGFTRNKASHGTDSEISGIRFKESMSHMLALILSLQIQT